jgi:AcrR family transcriptional regulator
MARTGARAKEQRRDRDARETLLTAASELMIEEGTHDVSLHAIARKAGLTAPLVKYYFGSKEGLLVALVERDTARSLEQLDHLLAMDVNAVEKMRIHISGIIRTYARYPYLLGLLGEILRGSSFAADNEVKKTFALPLIEAQRAIVEEGVDAGLFRAFNPDHLYFLIVGACQYVFAARAAFADAMGGRPTEPEFERGFAATAVDVILNGLRA